ncbi:hypothetical protein [Stenotrophomonas rhizophila]|uniref:hypothetical protein n=1 Tax=Stenotrophomonas rhizophila TaxID=216778 RepID=UPI000456A16E|nr:hypothetical protein [Stenotrophomonas rhizophila]AHY59342.1 hypothetical protein DX03_11740 [Stenotrophomonas rhizophila]
MSRSPPRRLVIDGAPFICSVRRGPVTADPACTVLSAYGAGRRLRIRFDADPARGCLSGDAGLATGSVRTADGQWINLHRPAVMRALIDAGLAAADVRGDERDGWALLAVAALPADADAGGGASA